MSCSFPTLGQLIKFAYSATGVLPRKYGEQDDLTESEKKTIQTQLNRLAEEQGSLAGPLGERIRQLAFIVAGAIKSQKVNFAIGESVMDLFEVYNKVVREDGTFLDERDSIRWICRAYAIPRLALSIQKHLLRFNLAAEGFVTPDEADWFLPTLTETGITWPLAKVMDWVYRTSNTNQTRFHYPDKGQQTDYAAQAQNLENAADWGNGKRLPSWPMLHRNFSMSMDRLGTIENPLYRRELPEALRESIVQALFLARVSTYVCDAIAQAYGPAFLGKLIDQFKRHSLLLAQELEEFRKGVAAYINEAQVPLESVNQVWFEASEAHWTWFCDRAEHLGNVLQTLAQRHAGDLPDGLIGELVTSYGRYSVRGAVEQWEIAQEFEAPEGFTVALADGMALHSNPSCSAEDVDGYVNGLRRDKLESYLPWIGPWLHAVVCYRRQDYQTAFDHIEDAFERAKYCAGASQAKLVNRYIELAAKTDRWKSFKNGVAWARYLGIPVRLLYDVEPTDDSLRSVFGLMKKVEYL